MMARKKYKTTTQTKNEGFREVPMDETIVPPVSVEGIREFWELIKEQGEAIRAKPAIIPRNHVWEPHGKPSKKENG